MPSAHLLRSSPITRTPRVLQLEGLFDLAPTKKQTVEWNVKLPIDGREWKIGLVVGPSGSGKTTLVRELFGDHYCHGFEWPRDKSIVDAFPESLSIKEITSLLSSVGFSSPPSWLRPFHVLSNGEQFRVTIARALAETSDLVVIDEFTSVVDRQVAKVASAAVAKAVRARSQRLIACSCHYDVIDWLQPDWIFDVAKGKLQWRSLQPRPQVPLEIVRTDPTAWKFFAHHHYLSADLSRSAACFVGLVEDRPAAFVAALFFPHNKRPGYKEHRAVCLPDFQGVGIGNKLSAYVASLFACKGKPYRSVTSHPGMIAHRYASKLWRCIRPPSFVPPPGNPAHAMRAQSRNRYTASFEYIGPKNFDDARAFGVL